MQIIVQKFGGTSVGSIERIQAVAKLISEEASKGHRLVVVVSAMAGETDRLLGLSKKLSSQPSALHQDVVLAAGEQVAIGLLGIALHELGISSQLFLGHQIRILTDDIHGAARIQRIETDRLIACLDDGKIPIIAGFQGVTEKGDVTTIGRGGGDTTAIAVAAALKADRCDIFTDVPGVSTADPRMVSDARVLRKISSEEMLELADAGAKVLSSRSVEIAARYQVPLCVRSSFEPSAGTMIVREEDSMENVLISGITLSANEAKVAIRRVPDEVGIPARIFQPIAEANINVDMILQNISKDGLTDLTFTVPKGDLKRAMELAEAAARDVKAGKVEAAGDVAKVSVVGIGMRSHAGVAHTMFEALAKEGIGIQMISTSEIKVSLIIDAKYGERAVRALHQAFDLHKPHTDLVGNER
ncbi:MAG: aspartate kinase [Deltaproteobacteria bacterium]|nr:aspartate kinase [Deltaproteobacteria bacterium]